jgi:tetratricopeptide (TPR) repeat protein
VAPESSNYYLLRGQLYLRMHQWKKAAADLRKAADLKPDDHFLWFAYAPLHLWAGDEEGYLEHRKAMLERFGKSTDPMTAERTAKVCSLRPGTPEENKLLLDLVKLAVVEATEIPQWARLAYALVHHRSGDSANAIEQSRLAREADAGNNPLTAYVQVGTRLIEAIGQHRLGKADEAKRLLAEADEMIRNDLPDIHESNPDGQFHDLVICKLLEREARALIEPAAPPRERGPAPREKGEEKKQ